LDKAFSAKLAAMEEDDSVSADLPRNKRTH